jgi:hypothetical protein
MDTASRYFKRRPLGLALAVLLLLIGTAAAAAGTPGATVGSDRVEVSYRNPAGFTEMSRSPSERRDWLDDLSRHVARRAVAAVPDGQRLLITITDVERAGRVEPWRGRRWMDVRIVRAITPPRIELNFQRVSAQGAVLEEGARRLTDLAFLEHDHLHSGDALAHEKNLIDRWLLEDFGRPRY